MESATLIIGASDPVAIELRKLLIARGRSVVSTSCKNRDGEKEGALSLHGS